MKLYNTLTKKVEDFKPIEEGVVSIYTCGPTVYNYAHIGNLRTYIFEDILEKSLSYLGYEVKRAMNITDVGHLEDDSDDGEDKMLEGAQREHKTVWEIADFYTEAFFEDAEKLNIKKPKLISKASDNIDEYIKIIEKLLVEEKAYISNGNVYFDVDKANNYFELSGKNKEDLLIGVRSDVTNDESKKNAYDFGLWFTNSKFNNQTMKWESPWGIGYPGWHIECSGISIKYLGEYLDIHCGGVDNIFPHHSNEIVQSEAYLGHKWCNFWVHGEHLNIKSGKMSKSSGKFLTIDLLIEKGYNPIAYRYFCLLSHYRNQLVFTFENLEGASKAYEKVLNKTKEIKENLDGVCDQEAYNKFNEEFKNALSNDLNTSTVLTVMHDVLKSNISNTTKYQLLNSFDAVLSLDLFKATSIDPELEKYILEKISERNKAKNNKDYLLADKIRDELSKKGIILKDSRDQTTFEIK